MAPLERASTNINSCFRRNCYTLYGVDDGPYGKKWKKWGKTGKLCD